MKKRDKKIVWTLLILLLIAGGAVGGWGYNRVFAPQFHPAKKSYIYIDRDDNLDSIYNKVEKYGNPGSMQGFRWMVWHRDYDRCIKTGRYAIRPGESVYHLFSRLYRGYQEPARLVIGSVRTLDRLARNLGEQLMIDSAEIAASLNDTLFLQSAGYNQETLPALFIPDTYEVYWNISTKELLKRLQKEHAKFWNKERKAKAEALGMTPTEVATLASIVEEETNNAAEKPMVAGLYINRLQRKMPLQADPTIKFALREFGLRRITNAHLTVPSPYNTYLNVGLPPGPIRIPTPVGIDAVLNYTHHNYLYMCAKEDFSGTHNFAATHAEHMRNARKYWNALNQRKIFK